MENGKDTNKSDKSYFAAGRHKKRQNIVKIGIPIAAAAIVLGVVFSNNLGFIHNINKKGRTNNKV